MANEAAIHATQARQLGLITRAQVLAVASRRVIDRRVKNGIWKRVLPGVCADVLTAPSLSQSSFAALLWAGPESFVSFQAAGALWRLDAIVAERVHVWTPRSLKSDLVAVHRGAVDVNDGRMLGAIKLTSPARTIIDLAGVLDDEDVTAGVEPPIHRGLTTPASIQRCLDRLGGKGRPGAGRLRALLDDRCNQRAAMSRLEVKTWRTLRAKGLTPVRRHPVKCGNTTYYLDCAFPQWRVSVEGFGDRFHRSPEGGSRSSSDMPTRPRHPRRGRRQDHLDA